MAGNPTRIAKAFFGSEPREETASRDDNGMLLQLLERIGQLEERLARAEAKQTETDSPFGRLFLARREAGGWKEQTVADGEVVEFSDGRQCLEEEGDAQLIAADGTELVMEIQDGESFRYVPVAAAGLFPVTVEKTGGADGTQSTKATWTYTVRSVDGVDELGTAVGITRPRPNGKMTFQTGDEGYGIAFYYGGTLFLWDAGEVPSTGAC